MAQAQPQRDIQEEKQELGLKIENRTSGSFKFNVQAPEFVPRSYSQLPIPGYYYPCYHYLGESGGCGASDWFYAADQEPIPPFPNPPDILSPNHERDVLANEFQQKIVKQVEYQLGDMSLLANESLVKQMNKDPEGYVPISAIASTKKIKSLVTNNHVLVHALRSSSKLIVSNDGKKVKRKYPFTDKDKEELQSRTVMAENLPEDHSHRNIERIFRVVGCVRGIRVCHPQESNSSRPKRDIVISNKVHALVEYDTTDTAEKAVEKLNDKRNWRKGLRVRLLLRRSPKSILKSRKSEFDGIFYEDDDDERPQMDSEDFSIPNNSELLVLDDAAEENSVGLKKGWARAYGKIRSRSLTQNGRSLIATSLQRSSSLHSESSAKQTTKGPRMPDGTRGFTMGRGKPFNTPVSTNSTFE